MAQNKHRNDENTIFNGNPPEIEKLYNGRYRFTFRCTRDDNNTGWYYENRENLFAEFGDLSQTPYAKQGKGVTPPTGQTWPDLRLIQHGWVFIPQIDVPLLQFVYETLTDDFVLESEETLSKNQNGFRQLTQTYISTEGGYYAGEVGVTTTIRDSTTLYLSGITQDQLRPNEGGFQRVLVTWSEAGLVNTSSRSGPTNIPNTTFVTNESIGVPVVPTGVLVESRDVNVNGFTTYIRTALQGTIEGVKLTYKDVADVRDAGTVDLTTVSKSTGGISGTIAVSKVTPPRNKTIEATVTVEITTTPPDTVDIAYDLGDISCSVTSISMAENFRGTDVFETSSGNSRFSGQRKTADMSARISTYPECYLNNGTSASGTFSYTSSYENISTSPNSILAQGQTSTTNTFADGTGATSADYATTGVIRRNSRPVFTAIDGTVYYEVITWTV